VDRTTLRLKQLLLLSATILCIALAYRAFDGDVALNMHATVHQMDTVRRLPGEH
jgi:hypothetical protein